MNLRNLENIEIIGINYKDKIENAKKFLKELDNPYKIVLLDKDGTIAIEWGAYGVPESFLVYNNKIIKRIIGPIDKNLLLEIKDLIK
jgi:cytochrome c biogenesis protein CcmG/thiol:disulfide interchange protein DsbE